jgi:hypothetical protein
VVRNLAGRGHNDDGQNSKTLLLRQEEKMKNNNNKMLKTFLFVLVILNAEVIADEMMKLLRQLLKTGVALGSSRFC